LVSAAADAARKVLGWSEKDDRERSYGFDR
jgi:hypothetical protein